MKTHHYRLVLAACISIGITGCSNPLSLLMPSKKTTKIKRVIHQKPKHSPIHYAQPTAQKSEKFQEVMKIVAKSTLDDKRYNKMALNTPEKKAWFKNLMYRLWDRQITRGQFIDEGLRRYPTKRYEFTYVANGFQKHS